MPKFIPSLEVRDLRAKMELRCLTIAEVAAKAHVDYDAARRVLGGRVENRAIFNSLHRIVLHTPIPPATR